MSIWYMVKRLDTGEVTGHDTWFYNSRREPDMKVGELREQ